ncbi:MAG TPA: TOBE domain-containing protein [Burkholderiales bacterium]|nr:TOBE domain-containing protein [Burkholderiales bacterium]
MKISAHNALKGEIVKLVMGPVSTEVTLEIAKGVKVVSSITSTSAKRLGLKKGRSVYAVIKASSVMIATE